MSVHSTGFVRIFDHSGKRKEVAKSRDEALKEARDEDDKTYVRGSKQNVVQYAKQLLAARKKNKKKGLKVSIGEADTSIEEAEQRFRERVREFSANNLRSFLNRSLMEENAIRPLSKSKNYSMSGSPEPISNTNGQTIAHENTFTTPPILNGSFTPQFSSLGPNRKEPKR